MRIQSFLQALMGVAAVTMFVAAGWMTRDVWRGWIVPGQLAATAEKEGDHAHEAADRVHLSDQARANLHLVVKRVEPTSYWRTVRVPGTVVERPGQSDEGVTTPLSGVVLHIHAFPGDPVRPGAALFTIRLTSDPLQTSQTELYKTVRDQEINKEQQKTTAEAVQKGALPQIKLTELEQQQRRLSAALDAHVQDLKARGLSPDQIKAAQEGRFLTEITIRAPAQNRNPGPALPGLVPAPGQPARKGPPSPGEENGFEVEEMKARLGEQVQAGQTLCTLAHHEVLYIEGRGFKQEVPLLTRTAEGGWPVRVEFTDEAQLDWSPLTQELKIDFLAATADPASQTIPFYITLPNQSRDYRRKDKTYKVWRFRPGQHVRLHVAVEHFENVLVLPAAAVMHEGPEACVFRANGDALERRPVHVLLEDQETAVLANDGSVTPGNHLAQNAAAQLNRVLKATAAGGEGHGGHGHTHSHD